MEISQILFYILIAFIGYAIGRIGHIYGGHLKTPHHWIYGIILMVVGLTIFKSNSLGLWVFSFGFGHFISDLSDFLNGEIIGPDKEGQRRFWGID